MSFFNLGAWGVVYTYTPELYPTAIRAMGSGWAAGVGRIGGMAAPLVVGMMIEAGRDMHTVFYMFASVFIIIAVAVFALGVETKQKKLEIFKYSLNKNSKYKCICYFFIGKLKIIIRIN